MGIELTIDEDLNAFSIFNTTAYKQLPYGASLGLNKTAEYMKNSFNKGTNVFDRPNTFTQKAFKNTKSYKNKLVAHVFAVDKEGADRSRYLKYATKGGARVPKGFELFFTGLKNDGTIPSNAYFMPTSYVEQDNYGNVKRTELNKIIRNINNTKKGYFVGTPRNNNKFKAGIYKRDKDKLKPYFTVTTRRPRYDKIFDLERIGNKVIDRKFNTLLGLGIKEALDSAR